MVAARIVSSKRLSWFRRMRAADQIITQRLGAAGGMSSHAATSMPRSR